MANFSKILAEQKKEFAGEKEKVKISEAAQEFVLKQQVDKGYTPQALKQKKIGRGAQKIVKDFETAVFAISDASGYADFADFIRTWQTTVAETRKGNRFSAPEQMYIQEIVGEAIQQISALGGVALRSTFAAETFMKQFKPMKLLQLMTQNIPIVRDIVQRRIDAVEAGELQAKRAVLEGKREEKKERLAGVESKLFGDDEFGKDFSPVKSMAKAGSDLFADDIGVQPTKRKKDKPLASKLASGLVGKPLGEESRKEADSEREESQDLFQEIADNTAQTNELLGSEGKSKGGGLLAGIFGAKGGFKGLLAKGGIMTAIATGFGAIVTGIAATLPYLLIAGVIAGAIWMAYKYVKEQGGLGAVWDKFTKVIGEMFDKMAIWFKKQLTEMLDFFKKKWDNLKEWGEEKKDQTVSVAKDIYKSSTSLDYRKQEELAEVDAFIKAKQNLIRAQKEGQPLEIIEELQKIVDEKYHKIDRFTMPWNKDELNRKQARNLSDEDIMNWQFRSDKFKPADMSSVLHPIYDKGKDLEEKSVAMDSIKNSQAFRPLPLNWQRPILVDKRQNYNASNYVATTVSSGPNPRDPHWSRY